jgi:hypothetical protein
MALSFSHGLRIRSGKSEKQSVAQPDECAMKTASGVREFHLELRRKLNHGAMVVTEACPSSFHAYWPAPSTAKLP